MADPIRTALMAARACIQQDRQALADSHTSVDGLDEDGAAGVAEYDEVLQQIEEALGALDAPGEEREGWRATMARLVAWIDDCGSCLDPDPQPLREARAMLAARPEAPTEGRKRCAQCQKPYNPASIAGCPKCAPGAQVSEADFREPIREAGKEGGA